MKRSDYPGHDLPRKELHERLAAAYQLASRILLMDVDPDDVRSEMQIVLLDFLSDPNNATVERLELAARGFHSSAWRFYANTSTTTGPTVTTTTTAKSA